MFKHERGKSVQDLPAGASGVVWWRSAEGKFAGRVMLASIQYVFDSA